MRDCDLAILSQEGFEDRLHLVGVVKGRELINAYHAMSVFAFASQSETQGLVLTEAMAAGVPVVAVDAPGVREVIRDGINGRLLAHESAEDFVSAIEWIKRRSSKKIKEMRKECRKTAESFSMKNSVKKVLAVYVSLLIEGFVRRPNEESPWATTVRVLSAQWGLMKNLTKATSAMMAGNSESGNKNNFKEVGIELWE